MSENQTMDPTPDKIRIQPNGTFCSQQEMRDYVVKIFEGFEVAEVWHDLEGRLNCTVEGLPPKGKTK